MKKLMQIHNTLQCCNTMNYSVLAMGGGSNSLSFSALAHSSPFLF